MLVSSQQRQLCLQQNCNAVVAIGCSRWINVKALKTSTVISTTHFSLFTSRACMYQSLIPCFCSYVYILSHPCFYNIAAFYKHHHASILLLTRLPPPVTAAGKLPAFVTPLHKGRLPRPRHALCLMSYSALGVWATTKALATCKRAHSVRC